MRSLRIVLLLSIVSGAMYASGVVPYVFVYGGKTRIHNPNMKLEAAVRIATRENGNMLWFRQDGRAYVIHDAAVLADVHALFDPVRELEPRHRSLRDRLDPLEEREDALDNDIDEIDERLDELEDDSNATAERRSLKARQQELRREMNVIQQQLRVLETEETEIDREEERREALAESRLQPILDRAIRSGAARPQ